MRTKIKAAIEPQIKLKRNRFMRWIYVLPILLGAACMAAEPEMKTEARVFKSPSRGTLPYRLYRPAGYDSAIRYPLIVCLHGAGGRGTDNRSRGIQAITVLSSPEVQSRHPSFLITPQCPVGEQWVDIPWSKGSYSIDVVPVSDQLTMVREIIDSLYGEFSIDPARIYVTGQSMGGFGTWDIIMRNPKLFAAAVPVCGAGDPLHAADLAHLPIWAFHGGNDPVVPPSGSKEMVEAIQRADGNIKYTEYSGVGHDSWIRTWKEEALIPWLFSQTNSAPVLGSE